MLNDQFLEEVATKRNQGVETVMYVIATIVMFASMLLAVLYLNVLTSMVAQTGFSVNLLYPLVLMLVFAGTAVLLWLKRDAIKTEYEYAFTNGVLDFAQVFNNKKRKTLGSLNVKTIDVFGPVNGEAFKRYVSMPEVQQTRWFLNREGNLHFFYFQKEGSKRIIVFEPSEELVDLIRKYLPHGAYQQ